MQIASRFVATKECDASPAYKQAYINARQEDVQIIQSPVGMPGRALRNAFIKQLDNSRIPTIVLKNVTLQRFHIVLQKLL